MKFDEVYAFYIQSYPLNPYPPKKLSKLELALYYLSEMYTAKYRDWRMANITGLGPEPPEGEPVPVMEPTIAGQIDFTRDDILEFLVSEGRKIHYLW